MGFRVKNLFLSQIFDSNPFFYEEYYRSSSKYWLNSTNLRTLNFRNFDFLLQQRFYDIFYPVIRSNLRQSSQTLTFLSKNQPKKFISSQTTVYTDKPMFKKTIVEENCVIFSQAVHFSRLDSFKIIEPRIVKYLHWIFEDIHRTIRTVKQVRNLSVINICFRQQISRLDFFMLIDALSLLQETLTKIDLWYLMYIDEWEEVLFQKLCLPNLCWLHICATCNKKFMVNAKNLSNFINKQIEQQKSFKFRLTQEYLEHKITESSIERIVTKND